MMRIATADDQLTYQDHPLHRTFVVECEALSTGWWCMMCMSGDKVLAYRGSVERLN